MMRTISTLFLLLVLVTWTCTAAGQEKAKTPKGKITVGKETTYVTGPLDKEGYVDYVAALNERLSKGVTPENNANVLLWKAIGLHPQQVTMPAKYFQLLGVPAPAERGEYFVDLPEYLKQQEKGAALADQLDPAMQRPWKAKDHPLLADWLKANEKPLAVAVEASKRSHYYSPLVPAKAEQGLLGSQLPAVQRSRALASALAARAMLRAAEGKDDDAWQDLLAGHRLGRVIARGATLIEFLVGAAVDGMLSQADVAFLQHSKADAKRVAGYLRDLQQLPPLPAVADRVDQAERFTFLESVSRVDRYGVRALEELEGGKGGGFPEMERALRGVDWDPALRTGNRWYGLLVAALREPARKVREEMLTKADKDLRTLKADNSGLEIVVELLDPKQSAAARGQRLGNIMVTLLLPAIQRVQQAADRAQQTHANLTVALALEAYRRERGGYPKTLDALGPDYLKEIPRDLFSGKALIYRPSFPKAAGPATGYLLYSVGVNGKDEGGRGYEDDMPGDDLSVRIPLPALRRP
jgi:hypothetical protein